MILSKEQVQKYCDLVCSLVEDSEDESLPEDTQPYTRQLLPLAENIAKNIQSVSEDVAFINSSAKDIIRGRISDPSLFVGSENVPHLVSVKQVADSLLSTDIAACKPNIEEHLDEVVLSAQSRVEQIASQQKTLYERTKNLLALAEKIKEISEEESGEEQKPTEQQDLNSTLGREGITKQPEEQKDSDSTASSFSESQIVTSSPFAK